MQKGKLQSDPFMQESHEHKWGSVGGKNGENILVLDEWEERLHPWPLSSSSRPFAHGFDCTIAYVRASSFPSHELVMICQPAWKRFRKSAQALREEGQIRRMMLFLGQRVPPVPAKTT